MSSTTEQVRQLLEESLGRFIEREYTFEQRNAIAGSEEGFSRAHWKQFAELGWLAVAVPEEHGGLGGGATEQMLISTAFGRAMVLEPYLSTAVAGVHALNVSTSPDLAEELLPQVAAGDLLLALAYAERDARYDLHHQATRATPSGNGYVLSGSKLAVTHAPAADKLIVAARLNGEDRDEGGVGLFLVDTQSEGITLKAFRNMDGTPAAHVDFDDCAAQLLVDETSGLDALEDVIGRAIAARCAEATGAMSAAFEQTVEYARAREQFGVSISSFQVVQHRLIDLLIAARECKAMADLVAQDVMSDSSETRRASVAAAKAFVGKRASKAAQEVVQLHGGIGMTEEYAIGHYFRYLTQFCSDFGSSAHHLQRYATL